MGSLFPLGPDDAFADTGGHFKATDNLLHFIAFAYRLKPLQVKVMAREAPEWVHLQAFAIDAKTNRPNVTKDEMRLMMQSLLADRFRLLIHNETQHLPILELILARPNETDAKLKPHVDKGRCGKDPARDGCRGMVVALPEPCGNCKAMRAEGLDMRQFAKYLTEQTKLGIVRDHTGLVGTYDFHFAWDYASDVPPMLDRNPLRMPVPGGATVGDESLDPGPSHPSGIQKALKNQLGLTLVHGGEQDEIYAIDRAQMPK